MPQRASTSQQNFGEIMVRSASSAAAWKKKPLLNLVTHSWTEGSWAIQEYVISDRSLKNKWRALGFKPPQCPGNSFLKCFPFNSGKQILPQELRNLYQQRLRDHWFLSKPKRLVKLPFSSLKRKLPTAFDKEKTLICKVPVARATEGLSWAETFISEKKDEDMHINGAFGLWICLCQKIGITQETKLTDLAY